MKQLFEIYLPRGTEVDTREDHVTKQVTVTFELNVMELSPDTQEQLRTQFGDKFFTLVLDEIYKIGRIQTLFELTDPKQDMRL